MAQVQFWTGVVLFRFGQVALHPNCCCPAPSLSGCCSGFILETDTLFAEVIDATNNCVPIGTSANLNPIGGFIWRTAGCLHATCFNSLELACGTSFTLNTDGGVCLSTSGCPPTGFTTTTLISKVCSPFELIFEVAYSNCSCCTGSTGVVTIRITKL